MSDPQGCLDELRVLVAAETANPHNGAAKIVAKFSAGASASDMEQLRTWLKDTLEAGKYTAFSAAHLNQHNRWLAVLEAACAAAHGRMPASAN